MWLMVGRRYEINWKWWYIKVTLIHTKIIVTAIEKYEQPMMWKKKNGMYYPDFC